MEWAEFKRKHPKSHLVAGEYDPAEAFSRVSHFGIVGRLVVALRPGGEWAIQKVPLPRWLAIHVVYERDGDALAFSSVVGATPGSRGGSAGPWSSVHYYHLSRSLCSEIMAKTAALLEAQSPPAHSRPKQKQAAPRENGTA